MFDFSINYVAALVAGVAAFLIGGLWYTVLFGKKYEALHDYPPHVKEAQARAFPRTMAVLLLCYLVIGFGMAVLATNLGPQTAGDGACLGLLVWGCVAAPLALTSNVTSNRKFLVFVIDASYQLVFLVVMGVIVTLWK